MSVLAHSTNRLSAIAGRNGQCGLLGNVIAEYLGRHLPFVVADLALSGHNTVWHLRLRNMAVVLETSISRGDTEMADKEVLVVASKVKAYIKSKKMMTSSDAIVALSDKVYAMLDDAIARTKANRRSTVKAQDL